MTSVTSEIPSEKAKSSQCQRLYLSSLLSVKLVWLGYFLINVLPKLNWIKKVRVCLVAYCAYPQSRIQTEAEAQGFYKQLFLIAEGFWLIWCLRNVFFVSVIFLLNSFKLGFKNAPNSYSLWKLKGCIRREIFKKIFYKNFPNWFSFLITTTWKTKTNCI